MGSVLRPLGPTIAFEYHLRIVLARVRTKSTTAAVTPSIKNATQLQAAIPATGVMCPAPCPQGGRECRDAYHDPCVNSGVVILVAPCTLRGRPDP